MEEAPDAEASAKLAQYLAVVVQVAEAVVRGRQQRASRRTDATHRATAATARANRLYSGAGLHRPRPVAGTAEAAADAVEAWLRQAAPDVMASYATLRRDGADRLEAMGHVLGNLTAHGGAPAGTYAQSRADTAADQVRDREATSDNPRTPTIDEHAESLLAAVPRRDERVAWQHDADWLRTGDVALIRQAPGSSRPHPADVAALAFAEPYVRVRPALPAPPQLPALPPGASRTAAQVAHR